MPKRPPKKWFDQCVRTVRKKRGIKNPNRLCGWIWYIHMKPVTKQRILRIAERRRKK